MQPFEITLNISLKNLSFCLFYSLLFTEKGDLNALNTINKEKRFDLNSGKSYIYISNTVKSFKFIIDVLLVPKTAGRVSIYSKKQSENFVFFCQFKQELLLLFTRGILNKNC